VSQAPAVSVVIPCWRCAETIERAVASVAGQTLSALEVVLVDDASSDGTLDKLRALTKIYQAGWVKVIALRDNGGPGLARNAGWGEARGEFIAFLDADDAWHPRKLELHMNWLASHPEVVLSGHRSVLLRDGAVPPRVEEALTARRVTLLAMLLSNRFPTRSVVIRRSLPFRFEGRSVTEDYLIWLEVVASGAPCYVLDAPLAMSFRPDFSPDGYSGQLWRHERRELAALSMLRSRGKLKWAGWAVASVWSLAKFCRRVWLTRVHRAGTAPRQIESRI